MKSAASEVRRASTEELSSAFRELPPEDRERLTSVLEKQQQEHGQPGETGTRVAATGQVKDASVAAYLSNVYESACKASLSMTEHRGITLTQLLDLGHQIPDFLLH